MSADVVRAHLDAAWNGDWETLRQSLCANPRLIVRSGASSNFKWEIGGLYRHVSQAWDFLPGTVHLKEQPNGIVEAEMCLTNGGGRSKKVRGRYEVREGLIDLVDVTDGSVFEGSS